MRFNVNTNQPRCLEYDITLKESAIMELFNQLSSWADDVMISGEKFYFISRRKVLEELPVFFNTEDTVYRHFRSLHRKGMIIYYNDYGKDYIRMTSIGKQWNAMIRSSIRPSNSENPEKNPNEPGKKSESLTNRKKRRKSRSNPVNTDDFGNPDNSDNSENPEKNPTDNYIDITKESDNIAPAFENAFDFLKQHNPIRFEAWQMQYKNQIKKFKKFTEDFNDVFNMEKRDYESDVIFHRLRLFTRNWIANQDRFNPDKKEEPLPPYLRNKIN